jgi:hypothetical protein
MSNEGPERTTRVVLIASMLGVSYMSYFAYRAAAEGAWNDLLAGHANAPEQYRIGVIWAAHWLSQATHLPLAYALAAIDGLSGIAALLLLLNVLERSEFWQRASATARWLASASFIALTLWFVAWLPWSRKPETLASAMFVAATVLLWQKSSARPQLHPAARAVALLLLAGLLAMFRADVAFALNAGFFAAALILSETALALSRKFATAVSAAGALLAAAIQLWLAHVVYPQATYGAVKMWQLRPNLIHVTRWPPFAVFMLPLVWMLAQLYRQRSIVSGLNRAILIAALFDLALWVTVGKIDEVRIFLPFAFALMPLITELVLLRVQQPEKSYS